MIGTPRPKCSYCKEVIDNDEAHVPFVVEGFDYDKDEDDNTLPEGVSLTANMVTYFKEHEWKPFISFSLSTKSGWRAAMAEIRYCPYCGRDLYEELNGDDE